MLQLVGLLPASRESEAGWGEDRDIKNQLGGLICDKFKDYFCHLPFLNTLAAPATAIIVPATAPTKCTPSLMPFQTFVFVSFSILNSILSYTFIFPHAISLTPQPAH